MLALPSDKATSVNEPSGKPVSITTPHGVVGVAGESRPKPARVPVSACLRRSANAAFRTLVSGAVGLEQEPKRNENRPIATISIVRFTRCASYAQLVMGVILDAIEYVMGRAYGSASSGATGIYGFSRAPYLNGRSEERRVGKEGTAPRL